MFFNNLKSWIFFRKLSVNLVKSHFLYNSVFPLISLIYSELTQKCDFTKFTLNLRKKIQLFKLLKNIIYLLKIIKSK
jgi:hypothetical protein